MPLSTLTTSQEVLEGSGEDYTEDKQSRMSVFLKKINTNESIHEGLVGGLEIGRTGQLENLELSWEGIENVNAKQDFTRLVRKEILGEYKREKRAKERG